jgi:hypothetical protein
MANSLPDARRAVRAATNHLANVAWEGGAASARVLDMSLLGARIATHAMLREGQTVVLTTVRMGSRPATIVRAGDGEMGLKFIDEVASEVETRSRRR